MLQLMHISTVSLPLDSLENKGSASPGAPVVPTPMQYVVPMPLQYVVPSWHIDLCYHNRSCVALSVLNRPAKTTSLGLAVSVQSKMLCNGESLIQGYGMIVSDECMSR